MNPRVTIVGDGIVGRRVDRMLAERCTTRFVDTRVQSPDRAEGSAAVVIATPAPHAPLAARLGGAGVTVVSVSDDLDDVAEMLELHDLFEANAATLVVGSGMSAGLGGLLARHVASGMARCDELHVATHGTAGPACARQHHRSLRRHSLAWHDGAWVRRPAATGRELCWFPEPVGAHDCYGAELPAPLLLHRGFGDAVRISARVSATRRDRLTSRLPMLRSPHAEGLVGALRVEVRGAAPDGRRRTDVVGIAERQGTATAATATAMVRAVLDGALPTGVVTTCDPGIPVVPILRDVARAGIRLQEFTGVPQPS